MFDPSPKHVLHSFLEHPQHSRWRLMVDSSIRGVDIGLTIKEIADSGKEIPDKLRPGYLLRHASKEDLEILKNLKSEDLKYDWPQLVPPPERKKRL